MTFERHTPVCYDIGHSLVLIESKEYERMFLDYNAWPTYHSREFVPSTWEIV